jgi:dienelactone hydrolase
MMRRIALSVTALLLITTGTLPAETATRPASPPAASAADVRQGPLPDTNTVYHPAVYADLVQWQRRRDWLRDQVRLAAGLIPEPPRSPLNAKVFGKLVRDGYTIEKAWFESSPGVYVTGNLYRPRNTAGRRPAVASPHGHWANGRLHHDEVGSIPARCISLARAGAVVFAYDMAGYNDNARMFKHRDEALDTPEMQLWGIGHFQIQSLNSVRVLDFLQSLDDVDPARLGVTGASGGGTQTFVLSAVDDRVSVACPVNMISSTMQGGCICENAPVLRIDTNNMEIGALFAPKPMLMVSASGDWTKLTPQVEFPFIRSIYGLYGAADHVANVHVDAQHNYNLQSREAMYRFFGRWLLGRPDADQIREGSIPVEKPEDMLAWNDTNLPADLPDVHQVIARRQAEIRKTIEACRPADRRQLDDLAGLVRLWLEHAAGTTWPRQADVKTLATETQTTDQFVRTLTTRARDGRTVREVSLVSRAAASRPATDLVLCVAPEGLEGMNARKDFLDAALKAGARVVFLEPFGTGSSRRPAGAEASKFFTTFNRTDAAEAVYDILTCLAAVEPPAGIQGQFNRVRLVGFGRMGPVCLLARALVPERFMRATDLELAADMDGLDTGSDQAYVQRLFVPYIRHFGGLPVVAAVAANGPLWLHNTAGRMDATWINQAKAITRAEARVDAAPAPAAALVAWLTEVK